MLFTMLSIPVIEFLVKLVKFIVEIALILVPLGIVYLIDVSVWGLIRKITKNKEIKRHFDKKNTFTVGAVTMLSLIVLIAYYMPQPLYLDEYDNVSIRIEEIWGVDSIREAKEIEVNTEGLKSILSKYTCRRTVSDYYHWRSPENDDILLYIWNEKKSEPVHFVITSNKEFRYASSNCDFIYKINDKQGSLFIELQEFFNKEELNVQP